MYTYIYSTNNEILRVFSSEEKEKLLPLLVSNVLKDIAVIDPKVYHSSRKINFQNFEDPELLKLLSIIANNSTDKHFHIIQEVAVDPQPAYFNEPLPIAEAQLPRRAPRPPAPIHPPIPLVFFDEPVVGIDEGGVDD